ncbi:hypothetical protein D9613_009976 [Agrocybe pediades]|uniref:Uncharacterized protein n=1 Tax=Agrocybe pediades TaxID=84607 RepID=A0A8H4QW43_9AGAR|nr:hypothetical protein D9613_009976 [Agrocybe pediades]
MAVLFTPSNMSHFNPKHCRRTATSVMAGTFDPRPPRDVLTSLLNGVGPYKEVEGDEQARLKRKQERKERKKQEKRKLKAERAQQRELMEEAARKASTSATASSSSVFKIPPVSKTNTSTFWSGRPTILIPSMQRSVSVSVSPSPTLSPRMLASTPGSTPGPSVSSSTSRTSSKRPKTPADDETLSTHANDESASAPPAPRQRRKRVAVRKGWKGWVEGSPPPSDKLINLDHAPTLQERRTRSGKNFDAISIGNQGWV